MMPNCASTITFWIAYIYRIFSFEDQPCIWSAKNRDEKEYPYAYRIRS